MTYVDITILKRTKFKIHSVRVIKVIFSAVSLNYFVFKISKLIDCQNNLAKLELQVEDCHDPERVRMLDGPVESVDELISKMEKV
jgi:IS4 transposase